VLISGATVLVAVAGMLLSGDPVFKSIGVGTMVVVACAIVGSLTVLPALMHRLGDHVEKGRIPVVSRLLGKSGMESRVWGAILDVTLRRPAASAALAAGLLVAAAVPAFSLQTKFLSINDLPHSIPIVKTVLRLNQSFPGTTVPAVVVVQAPNVNDPRVTAGIAAMSRAAVASGRLTRPIEVERNPSATVARVTIPIKSSDSRTAAAYAGLATLRKKIIPRTIGAVPGVTVGVTGETAGNKDFNNLLKVRLPIVFAFVLGLAFLLLLWNFRSLVIPATAIALNLLSVGAAYGVLVSVFQGGWGLIHVPGMEHGPITAWLPLFLFVILFGLSMDYHVFILSRIREGHDRGLNTREAIRSGITHSAGVITSAAIVMVAVFSTFATLSVTSMKQLGVGLAVAIFLDATIVRGLLLPAVMTLLGERNWYLPQWLDRLISRKPREPQPHGIPLPQAK
jgi:RND superfamily putative drug exporter